MQTFPNLKKITLTRKQNKTQERKRETERQKDTQREKQFRYNDIEFRHIEHNLIETKHVFHLSTCH